MNAAALNIALGLAEQGFRVFSVVAGSKVPAIRDWPNQATYDPEQIRKMFCYYDPVEQVERVKDRNVGIAAGRMRDGFCVIVDVDTKNGGRGRESLEALDMLSTDDWLETKRVRTWSGGDHLYFKTDRPLATTTSKIQPSIDTRGAGGYVLAPGSIIKGEAYVDLGGKMRQAPDWLVEAIGAAADRPSRVWCDDDEIPLDEPHAIDRARKHLQNNAAPAVEGAGGDTHTYGVACDLRRFGVSEPMIVELMFVDWNERCSPPWEWEHLAQKAANAFKYPEEPPGIDSPLHFKPVTAEELAGLPVRKSKPKTLAGFDFSVNVEALMGMHFAPVRWVVEGLIPEGLTILAGAPKIGKSWMTAELATEVGVGGVVFGRYKCPRGSALLLALEDNPRRLQSRFLQMTAAISANVHIRNTWKRLDAGGVDDIAKWIDDHDDARLIVIDTLAKVKPPGRRGASSYDADTEALAPLQRLALQRQVAIVIVLHERKLKDVDDWLNNVSGTLGLSGVADTIALLTRFRGAGQHDARLKITGRDVEETELRLRFDPDIARWRVSDAVVDDFDVSPEQNQITTLLKAAGAAGLQLGAIAQQCGKSKTNIANMINRLKSDGLIHSPKRGTWVLSELVNE